MINKPQIITQQESQTLTHAVNALYENIGVLTAEGTLAVFTDMVSEEILRLTEDFRSAMTNTISRLVYLDQLTRGAIKVLDYTENTYRLNHCECCGKETTDLHNGICLDCGHTTGGNHA